VRNSRRNALYSVLRDIDYSLLDLAEDDSSLQPTDTEGSDQDEPAALRIGSYETKRTRVEAELGERVSLNEIAQRLIRSYGWSKDSAECEPGRVLAFFEKYIS
jgi:hypothetical protein